MKKFRIILVLSVLSHFVLGQNVFNNVYNDYSRTFYDSLNSGNSYYNIENFINITLMKNSYIVAGASSNIINNIDSLSNYVYFVQTDFNGDTIKSYKIDISKNSKESALDINILPDSSIYIYGFSSNDIYQAGPTYDKGLMLKLDKNFNLLWYKKDFNLGQEENISRVFFSVEDNCFYAIILAISDTSTNDIDTYLSKIDTSGNLLYAHQFGGDDWDFANDFERLDDGTFILSGTTYSNTVGTLGRTDIWVLHVDTLGNVLWERNYGYPGYDEARGRKNLLVKNNEIYIAGGHEKSDGNLVGWLLKLDLQGDTVWTKMFDRGEELELFYGVEQWDEEGMILLGGTRNYTFEPSIKPAAWLLRIDNYGDVIWQRVIDMYENSNSDTYPYDMALASDGGILLSGYVINNQIQTNGIFHRNDAWFAKTDSCGFTVGAQPQALFTIDSIVGAQVYITNLSEDYCIGNLNIALYNPNTGDTTLLDSLHVYAYSQFTNGDDPTQIVYTLTDTGTFVFSLSTYAGDGMDFFSTSIQVSDISTGILSQETNSNFDISIFPNPAKDYIIVNCSPLPSALKNEVLMNVFTATGQLVKSYTLHPNRYQQRIFLENIANGVYLLNFTLDGESLKCLHLLVQIS